VTVRNVCKRNATARGIAIIIIKQQQQQQQKQHSAKH